LDEIKPEHIQCQIQNSYRISGYKFLLLFQTFIKVKKEHCPLPYICWKWNWIPRCLGATELLLENHKVPSFHAAAGHDTRLEWCLPKTVGKLAIEMDAW